MEPLPVGMVKAACAEGTKEAFGERCAEAVAVRAAAAKSAARAKRGLWEEMVFFIS